MVTVIYIEGFLGSQKCCQAFGRDYFFNFKTSLFLFWDFEWCNPPLFWGRLHHLPPGGGTQEFEVLDATFWFETGITNSLNIYFEIVRAQWNRVIFGGDYLSPFKNNAFKGCNFGARNFPKGIHPQKTSQHTTSVSPLRLRVTCSTKRWTTWSSKKPWPQRPLQRLRQRPKWRLRQRPRPSPKWQPKRPCCQGRWNIDMKVFQLFWMIGLLRVVFWAVIFGCEMKRWKRERERVCFISIIWLGMHVFVVRWW